MHTWWIPSIHPAPEMSARSPTLRNLWNADGHHEHMYRWVYEYFYFFSQEPRNRTNLRQAQNKRFMKSKDTACYCKCWCTLYQPCHYVCVMCFCHILSRQEVTRECDIHHTRSIRTNSAVNLSRKPGLDLCCDLLQHLQGVSRTCSFYTPGIMLYVDRFCSPHHSNSLSYKI